MEMNISGIKKLTYTVNTAILIMVFCLMGFFYLCKATFLVYYSIPTALVYVLGYILIFNNKLRAYIRMVYVWLTIYMCITTVCLGINFGFFLYTLSMIIIIYYSDYMAYKLDQKRINTVIVSIIIFLLFLITTIYVIYSGPIYKISDNIAIGFWIVNSIIVFGFLISYSKLTINSIISSDRQMQQIAMMDKLTGLYNRHYMLDKMESLFEKNTDDSNYLAMIDIDDFKKINDTFGHNAGDYVLKHLAEIMEAKLKAPSIISRWGGEEFLIYTDKSVDTFEELRTIISKESFVFDGNTINVTVTIGLAERIHDENIDKWIQRADERLYLGKNSGKNKVVVSI